MLFGHSLRRTGSDAPTLTLFQGACVKMAFRAARFDLRRDVRRHLAEAAATEWFHEHLLNPNANRP
jgi:hypothetical protein